MPRRGSRKTVYRRRGRRTRKHVPGWGGVAGRLAGVGMSYVSKGGLAYKALRLARKVADAVNTEYKIFDTTVSSGGAIDYVGGLTTLNGISQGVSDSQRIGDSAKMQGHIIRGYITRNGADCIVRMMLIWDEQNQANVTSDILETTSSVLSVLSPKNYDLRFRSKVLYDKAFTLTTNNPLIRVENVMSPNLHTQFNQSTNTIRTGALKLLLISNLTVSSLPTFTYFSRVSFTDN